ncbi:MAG: 2-hydroxy-3-oxopropionate reductase [SAR202 cluster bacterium Io17-Chloro-G3]|nr:MAG: 2-hydroxy-3-oxopropionate reductase [SAR202 cluster bacterium Io17-Chloro-G3]
MAEGPIGFIGMGIMGMPMAKNLIKAGYSVVVYNRTTSKADTLTSTGKATVVLTPRAVAEAASIIITMVTDSPDVEAVVLGPAGVIEGVRKDAVLIDMSTISPTATRNIAKKLEGKGVQMLDAPVSGGSWGAIEGTLSIMVGGNKHVFEQCLPVFQAMGRSIVHVGELGMGQTTKLVNQVLVAGTLNAVAEALVFAAKAGADLERTIEAVADGAAGSWQLQNLGPRAIKGDFAPGFMVRLQQKDLKLVLEAAREMHLALPATALISQLYASLEAAGLGAEGTQSLIKVHEKLAGIRARTNHAATTATDQSSG